MRSSGEAYIYDRGAKGTLYVRRFVPLDLVAAFGKREVLRSLRTTDRALAAKRARTVLHSLDVKFERLRAAVARREGQFRPHFGDTGLELTPEVTPALEAVLLREFLGGDEEQRRRMAEVGAFDLWEKQLQARGQELRQALARHDVDSWRGVMEIVAKAVGLDLIVSPQDAELAAAITLRCAAKANQIQVDACRGEIADVKALAKAEAVQSLKVTFEDLFLRWKGHSANRPVSTVIHQRTPWNSFCEFARARGVHLPGQVTSRLVADWVADMQRTLAHKTVTDRLSKVC